MSRHNLSDRTLSDLRIRGHMVDLVKDYIINCTSMMDYNKDSTLESSSSPHRKPVHDYVIIYDYLNPINAH